MGNVQHKRPIMYPWLKAISSGIETTGPAVFGGTLNCSSDITVALANTLTNALNYPVEALTSTDTGAMTAFGITTLSASSATEFTLPVPAAGQVKAIYCVKGTGGNTCTAIWTTDVDNVSSFASTADDEDDIRQAVFNSNKEGLLLYGVSTAKWFIVANINGVTISSTT